jgi:hypothetical protein
LAAVAEHVARQKTTLITYFAYDAQNADGRNVVYTDFPANYVWKIQKKVWSPDNKEKKLLGECISYIVCCW